MHRIFPQAFFVSKEKMMKKFVFIILGMIVMVSTQSKNYEKLENYLENKISNKLSPGVQFIVLDSNGIQFEYNGGFANLSMHTPVKSSTQFKMYSSTKMLTCLAIMQLVEDEKIELDSPISDYIDINTPNEVTIRKTLSHTAGFSRYPFVKEIHLAKDNYSFNYSEFISEMLPQHQKLIYKPGSKNIYSNAGYLILSAIVEKVSAMKYEDYVIENIVKKANFNKNDYLGFKYTNKTSVGYQKKGTLMSFLYKLMIDTKIFYGEKTKKWQSFEPLYMKGIGFGGGFSNAQSLAKLYLNVLNHNIISEETLNQTFEQQYYKNNKPAKQSLGWWNEEVKGYKSFHHAGGGGGYSCEVRVYPEKGIVRIMMMNKTQDLSDLKLFSKIDELWLE